MPTPDTRPSLLVRLRAGDDHEAWCEFAEIYRPVILRLALARGLQPADAEDLPQDVLLRVSAAMEKWEPDGTAKFRTWLHTVTRNAALNAITGLLLSTGISTAIVYWPPLTFNRAPEPTQVSQQHPDRSQQASAQPIAATRLPFGTTTNPRNLAISHNNSSRH